MLERGELQELTDQKAPRLDRPTLMGLGQAALRADAVTGDENWDHLLSYIQRAIEAAEQQKSTFMARLADPRLANVDTIAQTRQQILVLDSRISALKWVVTIPAEVKKAGTIARSKLTEMDIADGEAERSNAA